jgi:UDPglucose 6-dehydrogenase
MGRKVLAAMGGSVRGKTVAVLGLTFKPNTDDMRDAPSISIIQTLQDAGATIRAYDPEGMDAARPLLNDIHYAGSAYDAAEGAHAAVIVTEWDVFRALDLGRLKDVMAQPVLVDLRNVYPPKKAEAEGFRYVSVGRPSDDDFARDTRASAARQAA